MNMKILPCLLFFVLGFVNKYGVSQEFNDIGETGAYGYTTISYNPTTNMVIAYSETDLYGYSDYYYQADVQLQSNGRFAESQAPVPGVTWAKVTLTYQGSAGNTYTASGQHSAFVTIKYMGARYNDQFGFAQWLAFDTFSPMQFPFTAFSADTSNNAFIPLGTTYDYASATIPAACGSGDERTSMVQEYVSYRTPYFPKCSEFTQSITDPNFTFSQLNYGNYSWAILRSYFMSDIDVLKGLTPFSINSAYRNPAKESAVSVQSGGKYHPGSRHQYGDALDVASNSGNWVNYQTLGKQLKACVEPINVHGGSYAHAHLDWRTQATLGPVSKSCPPGW
jgi:hypothetical protein